MAVCEWLRNAPEGFRQRVRAIGREVEALLVEMDTPGLSEARRAEIDLRSAALRAELDELVRAV